MCEDRRVFQRKVFLRDQNVHSHKSGVQINVQFLMFYQDVENYIKFKLNM